MSEWTEGDQVTVDGRPVDQVWTVCGGEDKNGRVLLSRVVPSPDPAEPWPDILIAEASGEELERVPE